MRRLRKIVLWAAMHVPLGALNSHLTKLNRLDQHMYLREVLTCIAVQPINHIEELLPWNLDAPLTYPVTLAG